MARSKAQMPHVTRDNPTAMLSSCVTPGCTTLTMGGTCVEHDSPDPTVFPRGRPYEVPLEGHRLQ